MCLEQLFPNASYEAINAYLRLFGLEHKMPENLYLPLGTNQNSFSPGEIRSMIWAHSLWFLTIALKRGDLIHFAIFDESDTAIDPETVRDIFIGVIKPILLEYNLPAFFISHSESFKGLIKEHFQQTKVIHATCEHCLITYNIC